MSQQITGIGGRQLRSRVSHQRRNENHQKNERVTDYVKLAVITAVFLTSSCFAYVSFLASACIDTENQCSDAERGFLSKLYMSENSALYAKLKRDVTSGLKGFEFMVWDRERTSLSRVLLSPQYQRINLQPLNDELWLELNYLNHTARVAHEERSWALNRSQEIVSWNNEQRAQIVHHCVNEFEVYGQIITSSCVKNLVHLPVNWGLRRMANNAKLSVERLERARSVALKNQAVEAP